ncbi:MAG TPA: ABC transporter ATP-binding protein, partial [Acidimicrobiales bacterium]|nr:ABC transporter ATP-binding protein [Acidimicrobiales bacterium]
AAIEAIGLSKRFGAVDAVNDLTFTVEPGQVCGLLGPNGAGKTTTVRMIVGLINANAGHARLLGEEARPSAPVLRRVGLLVEKPSFVPYLSGMRNLKLHWMAGGDTWPPPGLDDAIELANLGDAIDRKVKGYSQGMRQRLGIAQALMHNPELLVLDEPTNGMDPAETRRMRVGLSELHSRGTTVLLSSHLLAEVEQICSHVLVVDHGTLVAGGTVADIIGSSQSATIEVDDVTTATNVVRAMKGVTSVSADDHTLAVELEGIRRSEVVAALVHAGIAVESVVPKRRLEDAYLSIVQDDA